MVPQQQWWVRQKHVLLQVTLQLDSSPKLRQPRVGTPRRKPHSRSLALFFGTSAPNRQDRGDIQQHGIANFVTSFVATLALLSMHALYRTLNATVGRAFEAPYPYLLHREKLLYTCPSSYCKHSWCSTPEITILSGSSRLGRLPSNKPNTLPRKQLKKNERPFFSILSAVESSQRAFFLFMYCNDISNFPRGRIFSCSPNFALCKEVGLCRHQNGVCRELPQCLSFLRIKSNFAKTREMSYKAPYQSRKKRKKKATKGGFFPSLVKNKWCMLS